MKLLQTALALAALANPVLGDGVTDTVEAYSGKKIVQDAGVFFNPHGDAVRKRTVEKLAFFIPRGQASEDSHRERRRRRTLELNEQRRLQGASGVAITKSPAATITEGYQEFEATGLTGATEANLKFTVDGVESSIDLMPFITDGTMSIPIELHNKDMEVVYDFELTYTIDGVSDSIKGNTFKITRSRDGDMITRSGSGGSSVKSEGEYTDGGLVTGATGRIYFESYGVDYACTGTVIRDQKTGRSLVLTAAHCVFDDIDWVFGTNVIFIPNRDAVDVEGEDMTAEDVHRHCEHDICGCWSLSGGVVHDMWADTPWPDRLMYDYGFYVVDDVGDHQGTSCGSDALDEAIDELEFKVGVDLGGGNIHGFGYSLEYNPDFRECADNTEYNQPIAGTDTYWLPGCALTGGASGGPWMANFKEGSGSGDVVSVNSWSYSDVPGMGGPIISGSAARCLVNAARDVDFEELMSYDVGDQGVFVNCYDRPCVPPGGGDESSGRKLRGNEDDERRRHRILCEHKESP